MYKILEKTKLAPAIYSMKVEAPRMARAAKPGQFLIVIDQEGGERIPLTICDYDTQQGSVTIVIQAIGESTRQMVTKDVGDSFSAFAGPLGHPSEFMELTNEELCAKKFIFVAGGLGAAPVFPQVKWLCQRGVQPHVIIGAKSAEYVILEEEFRELTPNVHIATDDGSKGFNGLVTALLEELVAGGNEFDEVVAIGPMIMMKFVTLTAKKLGLPITVSLNTIMVDGSGMCGACRVTVDGKVRFACVEGPEFDGHQVDFDEALRRSGMYKVQENHKCNLRSAKGDL